MSGHAEKITTFMNLGFIDEIILSIIPVISSTVSLFTSIKKKQNFN